MKLGFAVFVLGLVCVLPSWGQDDGTLSGGTKMKCAYCKGSGVVQSKVRPVCKNCNGRGYFMEEQKGRLSRNKIPCAECDGLGYFASAETCPRCNGNGYTMHKTKKDLERERLAKEKKLRAEEDLRQEIMSYVHTNNLTVVLQNVSVTIPKGHCFGCSPTTNRSENAVYRVKTVKVLSENLILATLAKNKGFSYDDNVGQAFLIKRKAGATTIRDNAKLDSYYQYVGERNYKDQYGKIVKCREFEEIAKAEYKEYVLGHYRGQADRPKVDESEVPAEKPVAVKSDPAARRPVKPQNVDISEEERLLQELKHDEEMIRRKIEMKKKGELR